MVTRKPIEKGQPAAPCFFPNRGAQAYIYVVALYDYPGMVKIGMTTNWRNRRRAYASMGPRDGDAIREEAWLLITEEWVNLYHLEAEILGRAPWKRHKREWFECDDFDEALSVVMGVLHEGEVSYLWGGD